VGIAKMNGCGKKYTKTVIIIAIDRYRTNARGVGLSMSSEVVSVSPSGLSRFVIALSVVIGFTVLVIGGVAFLFGLNFLGEALVLAGVFRNRNQ
jgi:TRAP-type mannitol/chloroaromatic compound transport system permease small subunit